MKILTYRELKQKGDLLHLMEQAFGWPFDPPEFEKAVKIDPRLRDGCIGFCALEGGKAVGYVGVMDLATRTVEGAVEKVGGIYGVATLPAQTRKGICTALMKRSHEYFLEKGYRFSFLTTSPTLVAYSLYRKLGYYDVTSFPGVYKLKEKTKKMKPPKTEKAGKLDFDKMLKIYYEYVKGKTGFVVRDREYMKMLTKVYEIATKEFITTDKGYLIFKKDKKLIRIRELIASSKQEMDKLIGLAEEKAQDVVYGRAVLDPILQKAYKSRDFTVLEAGHGVLMVKELTADASFKNAYGNRFYMSSLDHF